MNFLKCENMLGNILHSELLKITVIPINYTTFILISMKNQSIFISEI